MVLGQLPFRDYFQIVPPGTDTIYAILITSFGLRLWIPNLLMACLAGLAAGLTTVIASRILHGTTIILPALCLIGFVLPASSDATHHWFSMVAILAAIWVLIDEITPTRIAAAGAFCGLATCFTQTKGALAIVAFVIFLTVNRNEPGMTSAPVRRHNRLLFCGIASAVFFVFNVYFMWATGLRQWLFCLIEYPLRYYSWPAINNWRVVLYDFRSHAGTTAWISFPFIYATVPLVYIVFTLFARPRWNTLPEKSRGRLLLVALTGFALFLAIASSPSAKRLGAVSPPAMLLFTWLLDRPYRYAKHIRMILGGAAVAVSVVVPLRIQTQAHYYLSLPAGEAAFSDRGIYMEYRWVLENTYEGEYLFGLAPLYPAFHLRNPAAIEGFHASDYTRPEQIDGLVKALQQHHVPILVLFRTADFLWARGSVSDHLDPLRAYVKQYYHMAKTFPTGEEIWLRSLD